MSELVKQLLPTPQVHSLNSINSIEHFIKTKRKRVWDRPIFLKVWNTCVHFYSIQKRLATERAFFLIGILYRQPTWEGRKLGFSSCRRWSRRRRIPCPSARGPSRRCPSQRRKPQQVRQLLRDLIFSTPAMQVLHHWAISCNSVGRASFKGPSLVQLESQCWGIRWQEKNCSKKIILAAPYGKRRDKREKKFCVKPTRM